MHKQFITEYTGTDPRRSAQVSKIVGENSFAVDCFEDHEILRCDIFHRQRQAEDHARQWVHTKDTQCQDQE